MMAGKKMYISRTLFLLKAPTAIKERCNKCSVTVFGNL